MSNHARDLFRASLVTGLGMLPNGVALTTAGLAVPTTVNAAAISSLDLMPTFTAPTISASELRQELRKYYAAEDAADSELDNATRSCPTSQQSRGNVVPIAPVSGKPQSSTTEELLGKKKLDQLAALAALNDKAIPGEDQSASNEIYEKAKANASRATSNAMGGQLGRLLAGVPNSGNVECEESALDTHDKKSKQAFIFPQMGEVEEALNMLGHKDNLGRVVTAITLHAGRNGEAVNVVDLAPGETYINKDSRDALADRTFVVMPIQAAANLLSSKDDYARLSQLPYPGRKAIMDKYVDEFNRNKWQSKVTQVARDDAASVAR